MSIQQLKRLTLGGSVLMKDEIIKALQQAGCVHLIPLEKVEAAGEEARMITQPGRASEALAWLNLSQARRIPVTQMEEEGIEGLITEILANKEKVRQTKIRRDRLRERIADLKPWGEFELPPQKDLGGYRFWFYVVPLKHLEAVLASELTIQEIHRDAKNAFIVVISRQKPEETAMPVERSRLGKQSLSQVKDDLLETKRELQDLFAERESLTRWIYILGQKLARSQDRAELLLASAGVHHAGEFFLLQGWVPQDRMDRVVALAHENKAAVIFEDPGEEDTPPTLLENSSLTGGGAEAMGFFQVPQYRAWDMGNLVFYSFSLFFAMILNDAMYAALFGGILWIFRHKAGATEKGRRLLNLGYFMAGIGGVWGIFTGAYFGVEPSPDTFLGKLNIIDINNYDAMMKISVTVGVFHLMIANLMKAWVNRGRTYALAPVGWAVLMLGGLVEWMGVSGILARDLGMAPGILLMISGGLTILLFSSQRRLDGVKSFALRLLDGFKAIYNITGAFGDILSYMRLFALGLSGAALAMTFNNLAAQVLEFRPVMGVLFGGLILILGHILNFVLCIMSGVVHGMRLNVIEFVNWGVSDEGYPFKAFCKREE